MAVPEVAVLQPHSVQPSFAHEGMHVCAAAAILLLETPAPDDYVSSKMYTSPYI